MAGFLTDLRYGLRQARQAPWSTALVLIALGLAIGGNATVFSLANALLLRPLGVEDEAGLVRVGTTTGDNRYGITSWPDYVDLRDRTAGLDDLAATGWTLLGLRHGDATDRLVGEMVTWNYWSVVGVEPGLGRTFLEEEDRRGAPAQVAILSHRLWQTRFAGDRGVIGTTIRLSDEPYTVVGVAPSDFRGLSSVVATDVWVPAMTVGTSFTWDVDLDGRMDPWLNLIGRLEPGASIERVQASLDAAAARLQESYPQTNEGKTFTAVALERTRIVPSQTTDSAGRAMVALQLVMALVLLIACLNVVNVFVARATARSRDISLRFAMGATRRRIVRQLLVEGGLVAVVATGLGLLIGQWGVHVVWATQATLELTPDADFGVDGRVLAFMAAIAAVTATAFAVGPALYAAKRDGLTALRTRAHGSARGRPQRFMVAAQVALAVVVLMSAGFFLRTLRASMATDPGFDLRHGLVGMINTGFVRYDEDEAQAFVERLKSRVETMPGVVSASLATSVPLGPGGGRHDVSVDGYVPAPGEWMVFARNMIDGDYLATLGIGVVEGRGIDARDRRDTEPVAVVNRAMARRFWPDGDAVGAVLTADRGVPRRVVGVVEDVMYDAIGQDPEPRLAIPLSQSGFQPRLFLTVRTAPGSEGVARGVQAAVRALAPGLPFTMTTLDEHMRQARGNVRGPTVILVLTGLLALAVTLAGVYGVTAYIVSRRTHEFGVRLALGASGRELTRYVLREGFRTTLAGLAAGLALAVAVAPSVRSLPFGVRALDPLATGIVVVGVATAAVLAAYAPARRAARTEPMEVLGTE